MKVQVEQLSNVERKLSIEVPWDTIKEELDLAYQEAYPSAPESKGSAPARSLARFSSSSTAAPSKTKWSVG